MHDKSTSNFRGAVAVNQQVHTAMSVLLRLLPLLVVGCLLLQSLQPTAVSGEEVCDQTIEGEYEVGQKRPFESESEVLS